MRYIRVVGLFVSLVVSAYALQSYAASLSAKSPETQVELIELYTSEGCSSCPPADRWVSSLQNEPGLWRDFIPVAFHVDYWDYIGWPDRFASPAFTARQYVYAQQQSMRTVYTPGFFNNGKEWRWRSHQLGNAKKADPVGVLSLEVEDQTAKVRFDTNENNRKLSANIVLLGFDIKTDVKAGENTGRTLTHDFVVLSIEEAPLTSGQGGYSGTLPVPESGIHAERYALVAWVTTRDNQDPIQAVGGWLMN